jgi:hypothetical protein
MGFSGVAPQTTQNRLPSKIAARTAEIGGALINRFCQKGSGAPLSLNIGAAKGVAC